MNIQFGPTHRKKSWRLAANESVSVSARVQKLVACLLILTVSIGPYQSSIAMHFDMNVPAQDNQVLAVQPEESALTSDRHSCDVNTCQMLSACAAHLHCNPVTSPGFLQLSVPAQFSYRHRLLIGDVAVPTRFPSLLKRPPKS